MSAVKVIHSCLLSAIFLNVSRSFCDVREMLRLGCTYRNSKLGVRNDLIRIIVVDTTYFCFPFRVTTNIYLISYKSV